MGIFKAALQLKVATITADSRYEFLLYPLGTSHTPSADELGGAAGPRSPEDPPEQSWQYASLHTYAVASVARNHLTDVLVSPNNFVSKTAEERAESSVYTKFIIATKKEQLGALPNAISRNTQRQPFNSTKTTAHTKGKSTNHSQGIEVQGTPVRSGRPDCSKVLRTQSPLKGNETVDEPRIRGRTSRGSIDDSKPTTKLPPTCELCGTQFTCNHSLNRHIKNSELPYSPWFNVNRN
jgi:hypothetical protein